jgi:hypothetical protein
VETWNPSTVFDEEASGTSCGPYLLVGEKANDVDEVEIGIGKRQKKNRSPSLSRWKSRKTSRYCRSNCRCRTIRLREQLVAGP